MTVKGLISLISSLNPALPREPSESEVNEGTGGAAVVQSSVSPTGQDEAQPGVTWVCRG